MYSTKSESRVADVTAVYHDKNRGGIVQDTKVLAPVPPLPISDPLPQFEVRDEDFMDLAPDEVPEVRIAEILTDSSIAPLHRGGVVQDAKVLVPAPLAPIFVPPLRSMVRDEDLMDLLPDEVPEAQIAEILTSSSITPLQRVGITGTPLCVVHVCPSLAKFAYLRFTHLLPSNKLSFPKGAFGNVKAPTYIVVTTTTGSTVYRYAGNRRRKLVAAVPEALIFADRCKTRDEIEALLIAAGIEPNPGPAQWWHGFFIGAACRFAFPASPGYGALVAVSITLAAMHINFDVLADRAMEMAARAHNALMHALNGNTSIAERKRLNAKAFAFDRFDPTTWKFDTADAINFVKAVKDSPIVKAHSVAWVVEKLLMRRGVRLSDAFLMVRERYADKADVDFEPHRSNPTYTLPEVPDVNSVTATRVANGEPLTAKDRRALARVTKQSGIAKLMPDLGITSSISSSLDSASSNIDSGLRDHGSSVKTGFESLAGALSETGDSLTTSFDALSAKVTSSFDRLSSTISTATKVIPESLRDVRVNHSLSFGVPTGPYTEYDPKTAPPALVKFLDLLTDCLPMIVSDDPMVAAALQISLLKRHGFLTTILLDSLVLFVKKLMKWTEPEVVKQGSGNYLVDESVASMLYTVVYALIFQQQPTGAIGSLKDKVMTLNSIATFAKTAVSLSNFLVEAFKIVVNWIYENITGFPYYDNEEREVLLQMSRVSSEVKRLLDIRKPLPADLEDMTRVRRHGLRVLAQARSIERLEKQSNQFNRLLQSLSFYQGEISFDTEMAYGKAATTIVRLVGDGGIGKTTLIDKIVASVHALLEWPGEDPMLSQVQYEYDMNFQSKLSPNSRCLIIDDPFVVQNEEVIKKVLSEIYAQGNSRSKKREGAGLEDKESMYEHFELCIMTDMGARSDLPNNNEVGLARRFNGGQFDVQLKDGFKVHGHYLDQSKVTAHNLDDVWRFVSRSDGTVYNFWDLVWHLVRTVKLSRTYHNKMKLDAASIREVATTMRPRDPPALKPGRTFVKAAPQAYFSETELKYISDRCPLSKTQLDLFAASLDEDGAFSNYTLTSLSNELGLKLSAGNTLDYIVEYAKRIVPKGKELERPKKLSEMEDTELLRAVMVRGECIWVDKKCEVHGKACPSRIEPIQTKPVWWIKSQLAKIPRLEMPTWMTYMYETMCEYGIEFPSVPAVLNTILTYMASKVVIAAVGFVLASTLGLFVTQKMTAQAYSTTYARIPKRSGQILPGDPTKQVHLTSCKPDTDEWLFNKIATNQVPIAVPAYHSGAAIKNKVANLFCVESNLHVTVKHIFVDDPLVGKIALFGDVAVSYPLRKVDFLGWDKIHPIDDSLSVVWWVPIPGVDRVFVVTPRSGMIRPDLSRYLTPAGVPINTLTDVGIVMRPSHVNEVDDNYKVTASKVVAAYVHGAGDVIALEKYNIEDAPLGLMARCPNRTPDGSCGSAWYTRSTRVGNGSAKIFAVHGAYIDSQELAVGVPLSREAWTAMKSLLPPRRLNLAASGREDITNNAGEIAATVVPVATLPKKQAATQNLKNTIKRSPAYDVLSGVEIYHPIKGEKVLIPPPTRVPVDLRDPVRALQKMPLTATPWTDQMIQDYREAASYVSQRINAQLDQKFLDALYMPTESQVINGDPALDIPGIDMTTSAGWFPQNQFPGKEAYFYKSNDEWKLRPEWREESDNILQELVAGVVPIALVVDNGKMELRPPSKPPRNTSAYQALLIFNVKKIMYWYAAAMKYGRVANQTLYGVDLNSTDGAAAKAYLDRHPYGNQGDYSNFDATIGPEAAAINAEDNILPTMQLIRKHGGHDYSDTAVLAAIRVQTLVLHIFGDVVYARWFGNTSGGFLTTPFNNGIGATNFAYTWLTHHRARGYTEPVWQMYEELVSFLCYGDDYDSTTSDYSFDNFWIEKEIKSLGQRVTPAQKSTEFTAHVKSNNILKRTPYVRGNKVHWVLDIEVLSEIHAFIRDASVSRIAATLTNMDAALREWYHYGRETFDTVKKHFNEFLAQHSGNQLLLSYADLDRDFNSQYGEHSVLSTVTKQSAVVKLFRSSINTPRVTRRADRVYERRVAEQASLVTPPSTFRDLALSLSYKRAAAVPNAIGQSATVSSTIIGDTRAAESTIENRTALTSYSDDTSVIHVVPPSVIAAPARQTDPYPDQGMREVLKRTYRIADVSWTTASPSGTLLYSAAFPEALFSIPNIQEKLKSFRYLRAGVRVSMRINANGFAGGTLMIGTVPFYDSAATGAWRHQFWTLAQSGPILMSASKADTVEIDIPWIAPFQYRDLRSADNRGMIGGLFVYVLNPLVFSNSGAPTSLSLSIFASFIDPEVAGPDINGAPALVAVSKQSGEAMAKSVKNVIAGVTKATSTVAGFVKPFVSLLPAGFLDKPTSLAATMPAAVTPMRGMSNASGLDISAKLALDPEAQISVDDSIFGGSKSKPSWAEVLGQPGLIIITNFTQADPADTLVTSWPVRPNFARKSGPNVYHPSSLAYYSQFWKRWRGSIYYLVHFACPSNVTARVRISFLPNVTVMTAPPENQAGDVMSKVVSITGDTSVVIPIEYLGDTYYKLAQDLALSDTNNTDAVGRITISVLNEVVAVNTAAVTPIAVTVWMAAGPNFTFSMPDEFPDNWAPDFTVGEVTKQSSVRELMSTPGDGLTPVTLLHEKGIVTPESFTGPLDLMHRFTVRQFVNQTGDIPVEPRFGTALFLLLLPFLGWRGAWRFKVPLYTTDLATVARWQTTDANPTWLGGVEYSSPGMPCLVECPYYDLYAWRETYPIMDVLPRDAVTISVTKPSTSYILLEAVGDDFSLGPLMAPPPLRYTAPPLGEPAVSSVSVKTLGK